jgi:hypothetical protein
MTRTSLLDELLGLAGGYAGTDWFQRNAAAYLEVCALFGRYAAQHHDGLVQRFIAAPATALDEQGLQGITASGPPLPVLLRSLEVLRDMRLAAPREGVASRHEDLRRLESLLRRRAEESSPLAARAP